MGILQLRSLALVIMMLVYVKAYSQKKFDRHNSFMEIGAGYLLNGGGSIAYLTEDILVNHMNFNHGATASLHFGIPVFRHLSLPVGLAGKYTFHAGFPFRGSIKNSYKNAYPNLNFTFRTPPWLFSNLQFGPFISARKGEYWGVDLELLFGYTRVRAPRLTILGKVDESSDYYVYIAREPTINYFTTISPALGLKRYYSPSKYVFARAEITFALGQLAMNYKGYYPEARWYTGTGALVQQRYDYDFILLSLVVGTNIPIAR